MSATKPQRGALQEKADLPKKKGKKKRLLLPCHLFVCRVALISYTPEKQRSGSVVVSFATHPSTRSISLYKHQCWRWSNIWPVLLLLSCSLASMGWIIFSNKKKNLWIDLAGKQKIKSLSNRTFRTWCSPLRFKREKFRQQARTKKKKKKSRYGVVSIHKNEKKPLSALMSILWQVSQTWPKNFSLIPFSKWCGLTAAVSSVKQGE